MRVSVVIPTYKRPDLLEKCLLAAVRQDFEPWAYEVIVADDAASEETAAQVRRIAECAAERGRTVRYVAVTGAHGPAAARNAGWRTAKGEIIAFTDDDCIPDRLWLWAGTGAFEDGVAAAMGAVKVPLRESPTDYERNAAGLARAGFVTANCFCRRDVLEAVGGFDERFTMAWREDSDLYLTMLEHGYRVVSAPEAMVVHPVRPAAWGVCIRQQKKSMFNALLYKKHFVLDGGRRTADNSIVIGPPWRYYRIAGALVMALFGRATGKRHIALVSGLAWTYMTARFCMYRLQGTSHAPGHIAEMAVTSAAIPLLSIYWRLMGALKFRVLYF